MRRLLRNIVFLFLAINVAVLAQENKKPNQIDVRAMLKKEIKQIKNEQKSKLNVTSEPTKASTILSPDEKLFLSIDKNSFIKFFVLIEATFIASLVVIYRRRRLKASSLTEKMLKQNIKNIRDEKIGSKFDKELTKKRKELKKLQANEEAKPAQITQLAKKLSVSKGEVHLALKLGLLSNNAK